MPIKAPSRKSNGSDALDAPRQALAFGTFRIDLRLSQLFDGEHAVRLRPKTWAVLLYLAHRPQVLVSRDEILDAVWPDVAVTPDTLSKSITELRSVLGDDSRNPRYIETVHRRGFRFIAATPDARSAGAAAPADTTSIPRSSASGAADHFVGRDGELRSLFEHFAAAHAGRRRVVFVTGTGGIGKTALVDAFLRSRALGERAGAVWIGRASCVEQHGPREPYMPVLDALQRLVRPPNVERMVTLMRRAAPLWLAQMPWLLGEAEAVALRQSLQNTRPERMPREMANLLETLTADLTLVLVLEDLHWSDPATVDLLTLLAQRDDPARLLVIASYRPADDAVHEHGIGRALRLLRPQGRCAELALSDLTLDDVHAYLTRRFPGHRFPWALAEEVHAHTGGQPLFVVALCDHLVTDGTILDTAPGWSLSRPLDRIDFGVPDDVRRLLQAQFLALGPGERSLLEAASAAGEHIIASLLATALGWPVDDAEQLCETLARTQRFLQIAGTHEWPDGLRARRYAFTHALYRQVVYDDTPEERRIRLHGAIGRALERAQGARVYDLAPQLAAHFARAHDEARTLRYLVAAGIRARERFASREALAYLDRALALVRAVDDPEERQRHEIEVRLALGRVLGERDGFGSAAVRENYEPVASLCARIGNPAQRFEAAYGRWYMHQLRGERAPMRALADELATVAGEVGLPGHLVLADSVLVRTAYNDGCYREAVRHMASLRSILAQYGPPPTPIRYGVDPILAATTYCAAALWFLGDAERARGMARGAVGAARESGNPFFLAAILAHAAHLDVMIGYDESGGALAAEAEALSAHQGFAMWRAIAAVSQALAAARLGDPTEGSRELARTIEMMSATGTHVLGDVFAAFLADAHLRAGARDEGLVAVARGFDWIAHSGMGGGYEPELWRLQGELLLLPAPTTSARRTRASMTAADRHWAEAEPCLRRAVERARASEARSLELRAALSLGRAWQARGREAEAHRLLAGICDRFDSASRAPDLLAARSLRDGLAAR